MSLYSIVASVTETHPDGSVGTRSLPTFYLDSNVQGIVDNEHAVQIALDILSAVLPISRVLEGIEITVHAEPVGG